MMYPLLSDEQIKTVSTITASGIFVGIAFWMLIPYLEKADLSFSYLRVPLGCIILVVALERVKDYIPINKIKEEKKKK